MSEPTIKPVGYRCPKCRTFLAVGGLFRRKTLGRDEWMHCSFCDVDTEAMFGPDALVAVVLATFEWAGFKVDPEGAEGKAANVIVERLTGVKR
jgi:hypothetical protein